MADSNGVFIGIDLAIRKGKHLPIVAVRREGKQLIPLPLTQLTFRPPIGTGNMMTLQDELLNEFANECRDYVCRACRAFDVKPLRIAIDAPSAPTQPNQKRRLAERALDAAGISCFTTPTKAGFTAIRRKVEAHLLNGGELNKLPHSNQLWMLAGFALFETLSELAECIEVYPQATARVLGAATLHKSQAGVAEHQLNAAAAITGWPNPSLDTCIDDIAIGPMHDKVDAYLCAWVASLEVHERDSFGTPPDDVIWVPKMPDGYQAPSTPTPQPPNKRKAVVKATDSNANNTYTRDCPACKAYTFKRWPWGWDAHAAHKCTGIFGTTPEERKREYRERYLG
ncbi:DUF429 domain-containing protein [Simiduia curdlanivorans]|uniref:DUF429 domain-containing protein n=1 Tax=Simiduia curdlanivorans TaxID=1492769 RepID=A0ABV8V8N9_9GAMM|nr:DUF429 domain-containing protein [Simiduia curdlanivorans]MDN3639629.1 DUF429 domain-containing protein [Simiduia curdlanivorans]